MLSQECTTEDLMEFNEAAKGCLPEDEQCVVTRQAEDLLCSTSPVRSDRI